MYGLLDKHLTKKFVYRFIHFRKVSRVIDEAAQALNTSWDIFQVRAVFHLSTGVIAEPSVTPIQQPSARLSLAVNMSRHDQNPQKLAMYDEKNVRAMCHIR